MKKNSKQFFRDVQKLQHQNAEVDHSMDEDSLEKVELYHAFKENSTQIERTTAKGIDLELPFYGIVDPSNTFITMRAKDYLTVDDYLKIGEQLFQVKKIKNKIVQYPVSIDGVEHKIECKIAELRKI